MRHHLIQDPEIARQIWEQSLTPMAIVSDSGQFADPNEAYAKLLGYTVAGLQKKTYREVTHPEDYGEDAESHSQLVAGLIKSYEMPKRYITSRGEMVEVLLKVSALFDINGIQLKDVYAQAILTPSTPSRTVAEVINQNADLKKLLMKEWKWLVSALISLLSLGSGAIWYVAQLAHKIEMLGG